jgi:transposase
MSVQKLARLLLLPELKLIEMKHPSANLVFLTCVKWSEFEVCPRCATKSDKIYDHRIAKIKDEPLRGKTVVLHIRKRRFACKPCRKPFTEPVSGIGKGKRTTFRFQASVCQAAEMFADLKKVQKAHRCSADTVYRATYAQLERYQRTRSYPLPTSIGIDEHSLRKPKFKATVYATMIVDHSNRRVYELLEGRSRHELDRGLRKLKGCENVRQITMDLSATYKAIAKEYFPNAQIIADRFHVQRLFTKKVNRLRKRITGDKRSHPIRKLLLRNADDLEQFEWNAVVKWLSFHPELKEMYEYKEAMRRIYKIRGHKKARKYFVKLTDRMGQSQSKEVIELRKVLMRWRDEILNYHRYNGISNGRVEGFNRKAKLCQRSAYGIKKFSNYRLKLLNLCR